MLFITLTTVVPQEAEGRERTMIESHIPSLENCKKLKEAGYPQDDSYFYWVRVCLWEPGQSTGNGNPYEWQLKPGPPISLSDELAAPLASEIAEKLPEAISGVYELAHQKIRGMWLVAYQRLEEYGEHCVEVEASADTMPNAMSEMYCWLKEKGYLK